MARRTTATSTANPAKPSQPQPAKTPTSSAEFKPKAPTLAALDGAPARRDPTPDEIRQRAYEIYLARGSRGGNPDADWLQAERELRARR